MYGVWLASVMGVVAAGACRVENPITPTGLAGLDRTHVERMLGRPVLGMSEGEGSEELFWRADGMGGRRDWWIFFDGNCRVRDFNTHYHPFAACPPWLDALRDAFGPRPSPPAGNS